MKRLTNAGIDLDEAYQLIMNAKSDEEKNFIRSMTDYILQQKQKKVIAENRF
ncbi:MAG: hypothetical protein IKP75_04035 [Oscillospiraceae bacterium]|nr:hypothetical protein [Oscillospiraceae bacterium]MBR4346084.1 hypothetical protein [Oscillospiraceae bacterium]